MTEYKKHVHYDVDLETALLGACLMEKQGLSRIHGVVTPEVFYKEANKTVFSVMLQMWEENIPIDILTVTNFIARKGITDLDGHNVDYYVCRLTNWVVSAAHLEYHSFILRQLYVERELLRIKYEKQDDEGDAFARAKRMQDDIQKLYSVKASNDWKEMSDVLFEMYQHMAQVKDKDVMGVPSGFRGLDLVTGGFVPTQLIAIGARPSVGKSAFVASIAINAAAAGYGIGIISLEMPGMQLGARMSSIYAGVDFFKIFRNRLNEEQGRNLYAQVQKLVDLPIRISDTAKVDVMDIKAKAAKLKAKGKLDLLIIDYLQLIEATSGEKSYSRENEVSKLSRGLKLMAMEMNIPIIILCQLNRESEKAVGKKPQLHHLRESGSIEQDCDGVLFLHRDWKSGIFQDVSGRSTERDADIIIAKWRNGETTEIKIGFDGAQMRFYDPEKEEPKPTPPNLFGNWRPLEKD